MISAVKGRDRYADIMDISTSKSLISKSGSVSSLSKTGLLVFKTPYQMNSEALFRFLETGKGMFLDVKG